MQRRRTRHTDRNVSSSSLASAVAAQQAGHVGGSVAEYAGRWIAVRDGEVIASAASFEQIVDHPRVRHDDALTRVPDDPDAPYLMVAHS